MNKEKQQWKHDKAVMKSTINERELHLLKTRAAYKRSKKAQTARLGRHVMETCGLFDEAIKKAQFEQQKKETQ